ncbi:hypothetical protein AYI68_g8373 [Smittium mucronatum]|uniref:Peroxisomal membrane protein PEX14-like KPWE domain-containing protein n=1 Tax=Smittium mucronatum TaxID=133383 RepID=A0A1R0GL27_9FUNG|nr:hypothetical protein AYI68_g8373 [Smittium mucronatum]
MASEKDLEEFFSYDFEDDVEFQIDTSSLMERIKNSNNFQQDSQTNGSGQASNSLNNNDTVPEDLTLSQVVERLKNNIPIGGIKNVPDIVSDVIPDPPTKTPPKKPWEV